MNKMFLITGGNFTNKGAQSMLLITIYELKRRFENCDIWVLPLDDVNCYDRENLKFHMIRNHPDLFKMDGTNWSRWRLYVKNVLRFLLKKNYIFSELKNYEDIMKGIDCIIDISGYCLSSQFSIAYNQQLLNTISEGKKYNIPVVLMPQSFGPFLYEDNEFTNKVKELLSYPSLLFAREQEGYNYLTKMFNLDNVELSTDLVLQNKGIELDYIFKNEIKKTTWDNINNEKSVAVIPNSMNTQHSEASTVIDIYVSIIQKLIDSKKKVYIIYHSSLDKELCDKIYERYSNNSSVVYINQDLECYEYDEIVKQFRFIVASRYHSIVHAYKNTIPCIILGWATKYYELAKLFDQEQYVFDVRDLVNKQELERSIIELCGKADLERQKIKEKLLHIQSHSCFDELERVIIGASNEQKSN